MLSGANVCQWFEVCQYRPPLVACAAEQVEAYALMTEPILDALRFFTSFGYDVLSYTVVDRLASGRSKLKEDGLHISDWLQVISIPNETMILSAPGHAGDLYSQAPLE